MRWHLFGLATLLAVLLAACATFEERQESVVSRARAYALRLFPELTESQRHQVEFTKPRILQRRVLLREGPEFQADRDLMHTCVVWDLPDSGGMAMVVVGVGERKLRGWRPLRAVIRSYAGVEEEFAEKP